MSQKPINSGSRHRMSAASLASDLRVVLENSVVAPEDLCKASDPVISAAGERLRAFAYQPRPAALEADTVIIMTMDQVLSLMPRDSDGQPIMQGDQAVIIRFNPAGGSGPGWYAQQDGGSAKVLLADGAGYSPTSRMVVEPLFSVSMDFAINGKDPARGTE